MTSVLLRTLTKAINAYLHLDPESAQRFQRLADANVIVELLPMHFLFQIHITKNGLHLEKMAAADLPSTGVTKITGTPIQMLNVMLDKSNRHTFFADDIKIEGNAELCHQVISLFDDLDIDWEEYLAAKIGDAPAFHLGRTLDNIYSWLNKTEQRFTQDINEFLHEETDLFPTQEAVKDFCRDIDTLRMDVDRLEARLQAARKPGKSV